MKYLAQFILVLVLFLWTAVADAQNEFIRNNAKLSYLYQMKVLNYGDEVITVEIEGDWSGLHTYLKKYNSNYQLIDDLELENFKDVELDENGDFYLLQTQTIDIDVGLNDIAFSVRKYSQNFDLIFETELDTLLNDTWDTGVMTIVDDQLVVAVQNHRVKIDKLNGDILSVDNTDISLGNLKEGIRLNNDKIALLGNDLLLTDLNGIVIPGSEYASITPTEIAYKNNLIYGITPENILVVINEDLNLVEQIDLSVQLHSINKDVDGTIYLNTASSIFEVNYDTQFELTAVHDKNYPDIVTATYKMNNELGLITREKESILDEFNDLSSNGFRKAEGLVVSELPDLAITSMTLEDVELSPFSSFFHDWYDLKISVEIENIGNVAVSNYYFMKPNYCQAELDICGSVVIGDIFLQGESRTQTIWVEHPVSNSDTPDIAIADICIGIVNVDEKYDRDYSNNLSCELLQFTTATSELSNSHKINIYPNPSEGFFTLESDEAIEGLHCFSLQNQKINIEENRKGSTLDLSNLEAGIYFIQLFFKDGSTTIRKVVIL